MIIATWNLERLAHKRDLEKIEQLCERMHADILVLTESDERVRLQHRYCYQTPTPPSMSVQGFDKPICYAPTEHRVSIFTNYKCVQKYETYDEHTAICVELETEFGSLVVYGTIMGLLGNRQAEYRESLPKQLSDIRRLVDAGKSICVCGDLNCSFADNYYFTNEGRNAVRNCFRDCDVDLITAHIPEAIDHIALSRGFVGNCKVELEEWNQDKALSDHKGISARIISE